MKSSSLLTAFACIAIAFVVITSCQKEPDSMLIQPQCNLVKSYVYDNSNGLLDSATYSYNGKMITKAVLGQGYYTLEYNSSQITKRNIFSDTTTTTPDAYETFTYNPDGTLQKIEGYVPVNNVPLKLITYEFTYNNGVLNRVGEWIDTSGTGNTLYNEYNYLSAGKNLTECDASYYDGSGDTLTYSFDANTNYFTGPNQFAFYTDYVFYNIDPTIFPLVLSTNNVTKVGINGATPVPFTYAKDGNNNLTEVRLNGNLVTTYAYQCK